MHGPTGFKSYTAPWQRMMICAYSSKVYIDEIKQMRPESGTFQVDADTHMSPGSVDAAYRAAGGTLRAVDMVLRGEAKNAFVAARPPGHHAETATAMGFCLSETWHWAQNMPWIIMA